MCVLCSVSPRNVVSFTRFRFAQDVVYFITSAAFCDQAFIFCSKLLGLPYFQWQAFSKLVNDRQRCTRRLDAATQLAKFPKTIAVSSKQKTIHCYNFVEATSLNHKNYVKSELIRPAYWPWLSHPCNSPPVAMTR